MRSLRLVEPAPPISDADIDNLEEALHIQFPEEIRRFYLLNNGGVPGRGRFQWRGGEFLVNEFLSLKNGQLGARLEDIYRTLRTRPGGSFPEYLVPIATDPGGDFLCFSLRANELGAIYAYRNDYFDNLGEALVPLAKGLNEFIDGLA